MFLPFSLYSLGKSEQGKENSANIIPAAEPERHEPPKQEVRSPVMLAGTINGLYSMEPTGLSTLRSGEVKKILHVKPNGSAGNPDGYWSILGGDGILVSTDLKRWEQRGQGLPIKTIKVFQDGNKSFLRVPQEIKDLEINPADPRIMVCATKDNVYLSRDQGVSWRNPGRSSLSD